MNINTHLNFWNTSSLKNCYFLCSGTLPVIMGVLFSFLMDYLCYNQAVFTIYNFFLFNIWQRGAEKFGTEYFGYYFFTGLMTLLGLWYLPLMSVLFLKKNRIPIPLRWILSTVVSVLLCLECVSNHKEPRFLLSLTPFCSLIVAWIIYSIDYDLVHLIRNQQTNIYTSILNYKSKASRIIIFVATIHCIIAIYLCTRHQAGPELAMHWISDYAAQVGKTKPIEVHLLAPCYTFPGKTFVHTSNEYRTHKDRKVILQQPSCLPMQSSMEDEESTLFRLNPTHFWTQKLEESSQQGGWAKPDLIATLDGWSEKLMPTIREYGYIKVWEAHHADLPYDKDLSVDCHRVQIFANKRTWKGRQ